MSAISDFFGYAIPWWAWSFPAIGVLAAVFIAVSRVFGFRSAVAAVIAVGSTLIVAMAYRRGKQDGWQERIQRENEDADRLAKRARAARDRVRSADPGSLYDDDGFKRK